MSSKNGYLIQILLIPMIYSLVSPYELPDLGFWIFHGRHFLDHGTLLTLDIQSVLPTREFIQCSWSISIVYAWVDRFFGLLGACLLHSLIMVPVVFYMIYRSSLLRLSGFPDFRSRLILYFVWMGSLSLMSERPWLFSLVPLLIASDWISKIRSWADLNGSLVVKLSLLIILWVNLHASFILLPVMLLWKLGILSFWEARKDRFLPRVFGILGKLGLISAGSLLNPFFSRVFPDIFETLWLSKTRHIKEYLMPLPGSDHPQWIFFWLLLVFVGIWILKRERSRDRLLDLSDPFFPFLILGMTSIRNAALVFILLLPAAYRLRWIASESRLGWETTRLKWQRTAFLMVLILGVGVATPWFRMSSFGRILPDRFQEIYRNPSPFGLAKMIRDSGKSCPVFSGWYLGGFLRYSLVNRNFVDGRNSPFSEEIYTEFKQAISGQEGWERYLDRYGACFAVLEEKKEASLVLQIRGSPKWKELGHEDGAVLFQRTDL